MWRNSRRIKYINSFHNMLLLKKILLSVFFRVSLNHLKNTPIELTTEERKKAKLLLIKVGVLLVGYVIVIYKYFYKQIYDYN